MDVKNIKTRGTKTRQGAKKKKKNLNHINIYREEQDFRKLPLPEEIKQPEYQYQPLNRENFSKDKRELSRATTFTNLQYLPREEMKTSESHANLNIGELNADFPRNIHSRNHHLNSHGIFIR